MLIAVIKTLVFVTNYVDIQTLIAETDILQNLLEPQEEIESLEIDERITERIVNGYELRQMEALPGYNERFEHTTIITADGVFQSNAEIGQWACRISVEHFDTAYQSLSFLLQRTSETTNQEGILVYNTLTLQQLNTLDKALRLQHGRSIIGYSICQESYLRVVNVFVYFFCRRASSYDYPPLHEAYSKRLLIFMSRPLILDISASLRVSAQSFLLFTYFLVTYFQYTPQDQDDYVEFIDINHRWFLLAISSITALSLLLLRGNCTDKTYILSSLIRLRQIEQSMIGMVVNLINYGPFIFSPIVIKTSFLPLIILAGFVGYYKNMRNVINIAQLTTVRFTLDIFFSSLTVGSFCALGSSGLILDISFLYVHDSPASYKEFHQDLSFVRYPTFAIMLFFSLFRFPHAPLKMQHFGQHASNIMNGISVALLDNYALFLLIQYSLWILNGNPNFSPQKPVAPTFYCILTTISFLAVVFVTFPSTPNLLEYSLEKNPINPTWITKVLLFFNAQRERCLPTTNNNDASRGESFIWSRFRLFSHPISSNNLTPISTEHKMSPITIENPMQVNNSLI